MYAKIFCGAKRFWELAVNFKFHLWRCIRPLSYVSAKMLPNLMKIRSAMIFRHLSVTHLWYIYL